MEVIYKCNKHGPQIVRRMVMPHFTFELNCGCIYSTSLHGSWYRRITAVCDYCDKELQGKTFKDDSYTTRYYHIDCVKDLEKIRKEKMKGIIVDIDEEYENARE